MDEWRALVRRKAAREGLDLPEATVDELAVHLEDLHDRPLAGGASPPEARARVLGGPRGGGLSRAAPARRARPAFTPPR